LDQVGVALEHPKAQEALSGLGARISDNRKRVYFPPELVMKMVDRAPKEFVFAGRDPKLDLVMKLGNSHIRSAAGPIYHYDIVTGQSRNLTLADALDSVRLVNALPNIGAHAALSPQDLDPKTYEIATTKMMLENTDKHFWVLTTSSDNLKYELDMVAASVGGKENLRKRPIVSSIACVIAPLRFPTDEVERLIICGDYGVSAMTPVIVMIGGSAPYTLAGALTQMTAEILATVTIGQALCPGMGQFYYTLMQALDMRSGNSVTQGPELMALYAAGASMARFYGLPSVANTTFSGECQSHQMIYDYGVNIFLGLSCGYTFQVGAGSLESGNLYSHEALVVIDEVKAYMDKFMEGIRFSEETLAVADIAARAEKGEYVSSKLTLKYLREEKRFAGSLFTYPLLSQWIPDPKTIIDRAAQRVKKILAEAPQEPLLPKDTIKDLDEIMAAAQKRFA
jgi:trimethylamine--corrinoid protein Co-methyltransferase